VDIETCMDSLSKSAKRISKRRLFRKLTVTAELKKLQQFFHAQSAPDNWDFHTLLEFMTDFADFGSRYSDNKTRNQTLGRYSYRALLMNAMHFQDSYNYQLDRLQRCVVQYVAPDGKLYPFCSYNSGPCHRNRVEKIFSMPPKLDRS
jgi:uncharacterized radical SAM superfamily Fe-S cluster-containing enzyme